MTRRGGCVDVKRLVVEIVHGEKRARKKYEKLGIHVHSHYVAMIATVAVGGCGWVIAIEYRLWWRLILLSVLIELLL
jgi:hypothetical protein